MFQEVRQIVYEGVGGLKINEVKNNASNLRASLKYDGSQYHLHIVSGKAYALTSKRDSVKTAQLNDRILNFPELTDVIFPFRKETIIACEVSAEHLKDKFMTGDIKNAKDESYIWSRRSNYVASIMNALPNTVTLRYPDGNPLKLVAFSVVWANGKSTLDWNYIDRYNLLHDNFPSTQAVGLKPNKTDYVYAVKDFKAENILKLDKNAFDTGIMKSPVFDYEGFVITEPDTMRSFKLKRMKEADAIIIGYDWNSTGKYSDNGWIKSIIVAVFKSKPKDIKDTVISLHPDDIEKYRSKLIVVGKISGFDEGMRAEISQNPKDYLGMPVQCEFMEWTGKAMRHPRIGEKGIRADKRIDRCTLEFIAGG